MSNDVSEFISESRDVSGDARGATERWGDAKDTWAAVEGVTVAAETVMWGTAGSPTCSVTPWAIKL